MTAHTHCAWMLNSAGSIEKTSVSDSHLTNSLRVAWPRGFPLSLCPGLETIFWSVEEGYHMLRKTHATLGVHFFHAGPEGNLISTELWVSVLLRPWCARYPCQTLPRALFSTPLRMQYIRWKTLGRKYNVWAVMPSPLPQSCLLPLFSPICSETPSSSNFAESLFTLQAAISYPTLRIHLQEIIQSCSISVVGFIVIFCFLVYKTH